MCDVAKGSDSTRLTSGEICFRVANRTFTGSNADFKP